MSYENRSIITRLGEYLKMTYWFIFTKLLHVHIMYTFGQFCMCNFPFKKNKERFGLKIYDLSYFRRLSFVY